MTSRIIIMDEPPVALGVEETRKVLELSSELRDRGLAGRHTAPFRDKPQKWGAHHHGT